MLKFSYKKEDGFVLLFAVVLSSIVLAVTLGVARILFQENKFLTSSRATSEALFAANSGAECALYNDKSGSSSFVEENGTGIVNCFNKTITLSGSYPIWNFTITELGNNSKGCAKVTVDKSTSSATLIISKGYNDSGSDCMPGTSSVERQLELNY